MAHKSWHFWSPAPAPKPKPPGTDFSPKPKPSPKPSPAPKPAPKPSPKPAPAPKPPAGKPPGGHHPGVGDTPAPKPSPAPAPKPPSGKPPGGHHPGVGDAPAPAPAPAPTGKPPGSQHPGVGDDPIGEVITDGPSLEIVADPNAPVGSAELAAYEEIMAGVYEDTTTSGSADGTVSTTTGYEGSKSPGTAVADPNAGVGSAELGAYEEIMAEVYENVATSGNADGTEVYTTGYTGTGDQSRNPVTEGSNLVTPDPTPSPSPPGNARATAIEASVFQKKQIGSGGGGGRKNRRSLLEIEEVPVSDLGLLTTLG